MDFVHCLKLKNNKRFHKTPIEGQDKKTPTLLLKRFFITTVEKCMVHLFSATDMEGIVIFILCSSADVTPVYPQS